MRWFTRWMLVYFGGLVLLDLLLLATSTYPRVLPHPIRSWEDVLSLVFNLGVVLWAFEALRREKAL